MSPLLITSMPLKLAFIHLNQQNRIHTKLQKNHPNQPVWSRVHRISTKSLITKLKLLKARKKSLRKKSKERRSARTPWSNGDKSGLTESQLTKEEITSKLLELLNWTNKHLIRKDQEILNLSVQRSKLLKQHRTGIPRANKMKTKSEWWHQLNNLQLRRNLLLTEISWRRDLLNLSALAPRKIIIQVERRRLLAQS